MMERNRNNGGCHLHVDWDAIMQLVSLPHGCDAISQAPWF